MITEDKILQAATDNATNYLAHGQDVYARTRNAFIDGATWALEQSPKWIPVAERWPKPGQRVMFAVDLPGNPKHGKVYGGVFTGHDFSTPGWGCTASHWMPSPEPPQTAPAPVTREPQ